MSGCGCQDGIDCGCEDRAPLLHGYFLEGLTPDQAVEQIFPQAQVSGHAGQTQAARDQILASVRAGQMLNAQGSPDMVPGTAQCKAAQGVSGSPGNLKLVQTSTGLALTGVSAAASFGVATAAAIVPFIAPIEAIIGLFGMISAHHAQAVAKEQSVLCSAVPAANNYLEIIVQAVSNGQATPQQGIDALNSLLSDFESAVSSIRHGNTVTDSNCNAACYEQTKLHAIVVELQSQFQDLANSSAALPAAAAAGQPPAAPPVTAPPAPVSPAVIRSRPNVVAAPAPTAPAASSYASFYSPGAAVPAAAAPTSDWLPIAAVAIGAFFLMRNL